MIEKITKNENNLGDPILNPIEDIKEKLDYYRSLFGKLHELDDESFEALKKDISTFFTFKVGGNTKNPPERLVRISNNNRILKARGRELSYLTDISQLLAPPIEYCGFGRCNIPNKQVLYCATTEACAYWETRPQHGDVVTISHYQLKANTEVNTFIVTNEKTENPKITNELQEVYYILEDFFVDAYSLEVSRDTPNNYLFSALLSNDMVFYPVVADNNFEAILYSSVQKKKFGLNYAIRNDLIFEKYDLIGVETRFILDEYENLDPETEEVTTDQIIGSFGTKKFDFENGKILYNEEKANKLFDLFRQLQTNGNKQIRYEHEGVPKNIAFDLSPKKGINSQVQNIKEKKKLGRNQKISVVYQDGTRKDEIKYKKVMDDIKKGKCRIVKH